MSDDLFEWRAEADMNLFDGKAFLRVHYRRIHTKRWVKFLLIPDDGESFQEFCEKVPLAIDAHAGVAS